MLMFCDGADGSFMKPWVTYDSVTDESVSGTIHQQPEAMLLGWGKLAEEGRLYILPFGMRVNITKVTRDGRFTTEPRT